jgi:zinc resistance-associated protein
MTLLVNTKEVVMKGKTLMLLLSLVVLASTVLPALAYETEGQGCGNCSHGPKAAMLQLSPEEQEKARSIIAEHREKTQPLRDEMWAKRTELDALAGNTNADPEDIATLVTEMKELRIKLRTERQALKATLEAEGLEELAQHMKKRGRGGRHGGHGRGGCGNCPGAEADPEG